MGSNIKSDKDKAAPREKSAKVSGELDPKDLDKVTGGTINTGTRLPTTPKKSGDPEDGGN